MNQVRSIFEIGAWDRLVPGSARSFPDGRAFPSRGLTR